MLRFLFSAIGLLVASALVVGLRRGTFLELIAVAVILGALNATLGVVLKFIAFIPVACSLGCFSLVINGLVFWLVGNLAAKLGLGFRVDGFWPGFFGALVTSVVAGLLERMLLGKEAQPRRPAPPRRIKVVN
jgi:putative membrane protein